MKRYDSRGFYMIIGILLGVIIAPYVYKEFPACTSSQNIEQLSQQIAETQQSMEFLVTEQCALLIK